INKEKARWLGLNIVDIDQTIRLAVAGLSLGQFSDANGNKKEIIITSPKEERASLSSFDHLFVNNITGGAVPIRQVADLELESSPVTINHYNKTRVVSVNAFVQKGFLADRVIDEIMEEMDAM